MTMFKLGFCLAFDVTQKDDTYSPTVADRGGTLYGDVRLLGFEAALTACIAERLFIVGGYNSEHHFSKPQKIRDMLPNHLHSRIDTQDSRAHTFGNVEVIASEIRKRDLDLKNCCLVTSLYHLPRAKMMLDQGDLYALRGIPAETLAILGKMLTKEELVERLDGGDLALRYANECQGVADWLNKNYKVTD